MSDDFRSENRVRILHFSDLHLGVENYGRVDPTTGLNTRVQDFVKSLSFLCSVAVEESVDAVLFTGDVYKTCDPSPTHQREFARQVRRLQKADIPLIMVVGNHDVPAAFGKATSLDIFAALEVDHTHVIRTPKLIAVDTPSGTLQIAGLPWPSRHILRTHDAYKSMSQEETTRTVEQICGAQIDEFARQRDPDRPAVLAAHLAAAAATYSGSERSAIIGTDPTFLTGNLAQPGFDYVALGHIHKFQDLNPDAAPPVVYAGSLERIDFGEESEEKGFCLIEIEREGVNSQWRADYEFVPTPARRFVTIRVDAENLEDPTSKIVAAIGDQDLGDAVVRLLYSVSRDAASTVDSTALQAALADAYWIAGIQPQVAAESRERRVIVTSELSMGEALDRYIANNPRLVDHRDALHRCALGLERELETAEREKGS